MNPKEYLQQASHLKHMIDADKYELEQFRALVSAVMSAIKGNKPLLAKIRAFETKIEAEIDRYIDLRNDIENFICGIENDRDRQVLYKRYVEGKIWDVIAEEMYYSNQYVQKLHQRIMQKISLES